MDGMTTTRLPSTVNRPPGASLAGSAEKMTLVQMASCGLGPQGPDHFAGEGPSKAFSDLSDLLEVGGY